MARASSRNGTIRPRRVGALDDLAQEIGSLSARDMTTALRQRWVALFGADPSPHLGRSLMVWALAYRLQERALGGLRASTQRILDRVCDGRAEVPLECIPRLHAGAGTVLVREWHGVHHRVTVLDRDVVYRGRRYKSLSEVARAITGARWSGPAFFGLKRRTKETANG